MVRPRIPSIEPLESRIAPAALVPVHSIPDIVAGVGKTGATLDLGAMFDMSTTAGFRTEVDLTTNVDMDPSTPGLQAGVIKIQLFDDKTPLTVQNFLQYVNDGDYLNTFFHRLVDGFVLQGGGYTTLTPKTHIDQGPVVNNECSADPELSNVEGTVAMAKLGSGPNTATSEFFFNLGDNSSNLDNQNGGFTVFGKVISGMDVVGAIADLNTANLATSAQNSALTSVPVQRGFTSTPAHPLPTENQYVQVTKTTVIAPHGTSDDYTYEVLSVLDHTTHAASDLLITSFSGTSPDTLNLQYKANAAGVADVTVRVTHGEDTLDETFSVTVKSNLISMDLTDQFSSLIRPGQASTAKFKVTNNGAVAVNGLADIKYYAVPYDSINGIVDSQKILIGEQANYPLTIGSGGSTDLSANVMLPNHLLTVQGNYKIYAVVSMDGLEELYSNDNSTTETGAHTASNIFGTFQIPTDANTFYKNIPLSYLDDNGDVVKVTLNKGGYGIINVDAETGARSLEVISNTSTSMASASLKVSVKTTAGDSSLHHTEFASIYINGQIGSVNLGAVDLRGDATFNGNVRSLTLGDISPEAGAGANTITIGALFGSTLGKIKPSIKLGTVSDTNLVSQAILGSLSFTQWSDLDAASHESISAPGIVKLYSTGGLEADVTTSGATTMKSFVLGGALKNSTVMIASNVNNVVLGAINSSDFLVGTPVIPTALSEFTAEAKIGSFVVKGGISGVAHAFVDSTVAAAHFGTITVTDVDMTTGTDAMGFVADTISKYKRDALSLSKLNTGIYDHTAETDYELLLLSPA